MPKPMEPLAVGPRGRILDSGPRLSAPSLDHNPRQLISGLFEHTVQISDKWESAKLTKPTVSARKTA